VLLGNGTSAVSALKPQMVSVPGGWVWNLGMSISGGTLTISGADGTALSASNPAYVMMADRSSLGLFKIHKLTANQTMVTSGLNGYDVRFMTGFSGAVNRSLVFYVYLVTNDAQDTPLFALGANPFQTLSPADTQMGYSGSPNNCDYTYSICLFSSATLTSYDNNPAICVGSFQASYTAAGTSYSWTALTTTDGIGKFNENTPILMPAECGASATGSYFRNNGGTAPIFASNLVFYQMRLDGTCKITVRLDGVGSANGAGAGSLYFGLPGSGTFAGAAGGYIPTGSIAYCVNLATFSICQVEFDYGTSACVFRNQATGALLTNADFNSGVNRSLITSFVYPMNIIA
jgi:hypothetical protein